MELTKEQSDAVEKINWWLSHGGREYTLGGYAGTGKTTLVSHLYRTIRGVRVACPTGKAAAVLRAKGVHGALTVHAAVYDCIGEDDAGRPEFVKKDKPRSEGASLLIVDEASMVDHRMYSDLISIKHPILWVGDHGQLESVAPGPNLMRDPTIRLEEIHRQVADSPILQFAAHMRQSKKWTGPLETSGLRLVRSAKAFCDVIKSVPHDIVIVPTNAMRHSLNAYERSLRWKKPNPLFEVGDRLICLRNNYAYGIFNGEMAVVTKIKHKNDAVIFVDLEKDDGTLLTDAQILISGVAAQGPVSVPDNVLWMDYGYVITCHKAQGSEWDRVIVKDCSAAHRWEVPRWRYTAVTRAAKELTYVL